MNEMKPLNCMKYEKIENIYKIKRKIYRKMYNLLFLVHTNRENIVLICAEKEIIIMNKCRKILLPLLIIGVMVGLTGCGCAMDEGDAGQDSTMQSTDTTTTTTREETTERETTKEVTTKDYTDEDTTMDREINEGVTDGILEEIGEQIGTDLGIDGTDDSTGTTR